MKILLIGPLPKPITGVSLANKTLLACFRKKGIQVSAINTISKLGVSSKGGEHFSLLKVIEFLLIYLKVFKIGFPNIIYCTPGQTFFGVAKYAPFIFYAKLFKIPYVIHLHGNYLGREYSQLVGWKKRVFKKLIAGAAAGIVLSKSLRKNFEGLIPQTCVFEVKNFVNEYIILKNLQEKSYEQPVFLFLSNLMKEKGIGAFLDALAVLKSENKKFKAFIAGAIETGMKERIEQKLEALKPEAEYLGVVQGKEKRAVLLRSNIFVFPTFYAMEGQPIALLEAMATGNIPVVTAHAGIPDVVSPENAVFVEKENVQDLVQQLSVLAGNLKGYKSMAALNLEMIKEAYREEKFSDAVLCILKKYAKA